MKSKSKLRALLSKGFARQPKRGTRRLKSRSFGAELLESRRVLASFLVSTNADSLFAGGTLRSAILQANANPGADQIVFSPATNFAEFDLLFGQMTITDSLTITGNGINNTVIDAQSSFRIFNITGGSVVLENVSLKNGRTTGPEESGGAVSSSSTGTLTIRQSTLTGNATFGNSAKGGAVYTYGYLELQQSTISGNSTFGQDSVGGAVATYSGLETTESNLSGNSTAGVGAYGGAAYAGGPSVISNSTLTGNFTTGLAAHGGAVTVFRYDLQIIRSTLSGNSVFGTDAGGGAIFSRAEDSFLYRNRLTVRESTLSGNSAFGAGGYGGAILAFSRYLTLTQSTISGNAAIGPNSDGGAVWVYDADVDVVNSTITGNSATRSGGAIGADIAASDRNLTIQNSIIASNTAPSNADFEVTATFGGVVDVRNSLIGRSNGTGLTPTGSTTPDAQGNFVGGSTPATAINPLLSPLANNGGPTQTHALQPNSLAVDRGGNDLAPLFFDQRGSVFPRIVNGTVDMGAFELQRLTQPIIVSSNLDELDFDLRPGQLSLREAIFLANTIAGANAITFDLRTDDVVFNLPLGQLNITESVTITGNGATNTVIDAAQASRIFEVQAGSLTLNRLKLQNGRTTANSVAGFGGAIFFNTGPSETLTVNESVLSGNSTTGSGAKGGAIYSPSGAVVIKQSTISGNSTSGSASFGGGLATQRGAVTLIQSTISGNSALGTNADGGGVWVDNSIVQIINSTVTDNFAARSGGGFGVLVDASDKKLTIHNSIIAGNSAVVSAPDFRPPISPSINREVRSSLIGSNGGTGLTATIGTTPDANGNFVGGVGTEIDPQLGVLTNNGAAVPTHSLQFGSLAIDTGSNARAIDVTLPGNPALISDQRGNPFSRIFNSTVDIGAYERIIVSDPLVVSTNADELDANTSSGDLSLREAIALASGALGSENITFASSTNAAEFDLALGQLEITTSLTITGNGTASTVIDARQLSRIFAIEAGDVTLAGLTLKNGKTTLAGSKGRGGAIASLSTGLLTIQESLLIGNSTTGPEANGGAIFTDTGAVSLIGSFVSSNSSNAEGAGISATSGDVTLTNSTVSGNSTAGDDSNGGGIFANSGNVTLINSAVSNNSTAGNGSSGGGIFANSGDVTMTGSTVSDNNTTGIAAYGGGIFASAGSVTLTGSTVSGNSTAGDLSKGGGIFASAGTLTLTGSTVSGNSTAGRSAGGGGIAALGSATLTDSTVSGNTTAGYFAGGGGVHSNGNLTLTGSTVSGNSTTNRFADGGGIFNDYGNITLIGSTVSSNSTTDRDSDGGGLYARFGNVTLTDSTVSSNSTSGTDSSVGGLGSRSGNITLTRSVVSGNITKGFGGGILAFYGNVTLMGSTVSGNTTAGTEAFGGGILTVSGNITMLNSTLSGNQVLGVNSEGGGLWFNDSIVKIVNSTITANSATGAGGGLGMFADAADKKLTIHNSIIAGNTATSNPDFIAPTTPATNLEVRNSLIGRSDGTTLTAAGLTPNTNGNLVGGTTVGTAINPLLGPLTNNGGPLQTHALLTGSPAINRGDNALAVDVTQLFPPALPNDQRGKPIARIANSIVDMGAYELFTVGGPIVVSTNVDEFDGNISSGNLSLREAIALANASPGLDSIAFATSTSAAQFDLTLGQLEISESVTITGNGTTETTIDAQQSSRIFNIPNGDVTLNGLTLMNGMTTQSNAAGSGGAIKFSSTGTLIINNSVLSGNSTTGGTARGGSVYSGFGNLTINGSTLSGNSTTGASAAGGAIHARGGVVSINQSTVSGNSTAGIGASGGGIYSQAGAVTINQSTIVGNSTLAVTGSSFGGGIGVASGPVTIVQSTLSGNGTASLNSDGGGLWVDDSIVKIINSTLTANVAGGAGGGIGVGVDASDKKLTIHNSIVAANSAQAHTDFRSPTSPSLNLEVRNSLIGRSNGTTLVPTVGTTPDANGNLIGGTNPSTAINPQLDPLASNGAPTQTHALRSNSLAIDRGNNALAVDVTQPGTPALTNDQRGNPFSRMFNTTVDIGAFELQTLAPAFFVVTTTNDELNYSNTEVSLREAINSANGSPGPDTITFAPSTNAAEFDLSRGVMVIAETLTITGNGANNTVIDAQQASSIFNFQVGDFTLNSLTLKNGKSTGFGGGGAAIASSSTGQLTLQRTVLSGNSTMGQFAHGGAIYSNSGRL